MKVPFGIRAILQRARFEYGYDIFDNDDIPTTEAELAQHPWVTNFFDGAEYRGLRHPFRLFLDPYCHRSLAALISRCHRFFFFLPSAARRIHEQPSGILADLIREVAISSLVDLNYAPRFFSDSRGRGRLLVYIANAGAPFDVNPRAMTVSLRRDRAERRGQKRRAAAALVDPANDDASSDDEPVQMPNCSLAAGANPSEIPGATGTADGPPIETPCDASNPPHEEADVSSTLENPEEEINPELLAYFVDEILAEEMAATALAPAHAVPPAVPTTPADPPDDQDSTTMLSESELAMLHFFLSND